MTARLVRRARVLRWLVADFIYKHSMPVGAILFALAYAITRAFVPHIGLKYLLTAHRCKPWPLLSRTIRRELPLIQRFADVLLSPLPGDPRNIAEGIAQRSIVLKWPRQTADSIEKGVILITFTTSFTYYLRFVDLARLQRWFTIVLEPSWSGYSLPEILAWTKYAQFPVIVQASESSDFALLSGLKSNLVPVTFGASDWVDHRVFTPLPDVPKRFDAVYVGNYKPIKRHHVLFRAIKQIADPSFRVAIACTPWGGGTSKQTFLDLIDWYGVSGNVTVFEGLPAPELNRLLCESKVCVLLSLKEGSNRSIFEAYFANVPGVVLRKNVGVNKSYINEHTGRLIEERELKDTLLLFREHWSRFSPRTWAMANISPEQTTRKLEEVLKNLAESRNEPWTAGLAVKVNRPEVEYFDPSDRFPLSVRELMTLFDAGQTRTDEEIAGILLEDRSA